MDSGKRFAHLLKIMLCSAILSSCNTSSSENTTEHTNPENNKEVLSVTLDTNSEIQQNSINISLTPNAVIDFSKDIDASSVNTSTIILQTADGTAVSDYKLAVNKNKIILSVLKELKPSIKYNMTISEKVTALDKEHLKSAAVFDFTTGNKTFPTAFLISPADLDNASQTPNIEFDFSVPVQNVEAPNVILKDQEGNIIETSDIINYPFLGGDVSLRFYNFFPKKALKPNQSYSVILSSNIIDENGNPLKETTFSFHTGSTITPEVSLKSPTPNEKNISQQPTIEFNISGSDSDFINVDSDHIYLLDTTDPTNQEITLHITKGSHENNNFIAHLDDSNVHSLIAQRKYKIMFSSDITDSEGNHIAPTSYFFTTGSYITPDVSMIDPVNNAKEISQTPTLAFEFSGAEGLVQNVDSDNVFLINESNPNAAHIGLTIVSGSSGVNNYVSSLA
jgi:hypothetical protein